MSKWMDWVKENYLFLILLGVISNWTYGLYGWSFLFLFSGIGILVVCVYGLLKLELVAMISRWSKNVTIGVGMLFFLCVCLVGALHFLLIPESLKMINLWMLFGITSVFILVSVFKEDIKKYSVHKEVLENEWREK